MIFYEFTMHIVTSAQNDGKKCMMRRKETTERCMILEKPFLFHPITQIAYKHTGDR